MLALAAVIRVCYAAQETNVWRWWRSLRDRKEKAAKNAAAVFVKTGTARF